MDGADQGTQGNSLFLKINAFGLYSCRSVAHWENSGRHAAERSSCTENLQFTAHSFGLITIVPNFLTESLQMN